MRLEAGDPIKVFRKSKKYYHFGIYAGNQEVIHYVETRKFNGKIMKTTMNQFNKDSEKVELVIFPESRDGRTASVPIEAFKCTQNLINLGSWLDYFLSQFNHYKVFSKKETLARAEDKVGEDKYDIFFNNCEHFVWWCKTGIKRSEQVKDAFNFPIPLPIPKSPKIPIPTLDEEPGNIIKDIAKKVAVTVILGKVFGGSIKKW